MSIIYWIAKNILDPHVWLFWIKVIFFGYFVLAAVGGIKICIHKLRRGVWPPLPETKPSETWPEDHSL